jgi:hypothetical protein
MARFRLLSGYAFAPSRIHAISQFLDRPCVVIGISTALDGLEPRSNVAAKRLQSPVPFSEEAQSFADHFAGRLVHAGGHFLVDQLFKFWSEGDVHKASVAPQARNVQNGYWDNGSAPHFSVVQEKEDAHY